MKHSFVWFELAADDLAKAKNFYYDMFGWEMADMGGYVMVTAGAAEKLGMGMKDNPGLGKIPSHWTPFVSVEDTKLATAKAIELGARVLHGYPRNAKRDSQCPA